MAEYALEEPCEFIYRIKAVTKVVDGDTVDCVFDLGFDVMFHSRVRLLGIDTPESRTSDPFEKLYGKAATEFLKKWLDGGDVTIKTHKDGRGKFGRILGELWVFDTNVNKKMIEEHHAVEYHGQSKEEIAEQHIINRAYHNL